VPVDVRDKEDITLMTAGDVVAKVRIQTFRTVWVKVFLRVRLTSNGIVEVGEAMFKENDKWQSATVVTEYCHEPSQVDLAEWVGLEARMQAMDDAETRIDEARNELEGLLFKAETDLATDWAEFVPPDEAVRYRAIIARAKAWFNQNAAERLPAERYLEFVRAIHAPGREIYQRKAAYEELVGKLMPLVKDLSRITLDLSLDLPNSDKPEYLRLQFEVQAMQRNIEDFARRPKYLPLEVPIDELREEVQNCRVRIGEFRRRSRTV
jgi:hypothetical protein